MFVVESGAVTQNCTYLRNDGFPLALPDDADATVTYSVERCGGDVCFLRLDFETFDIFGTGATTTEAACAVDTFDVVVGFGIPQFALKRKGCQEEG